MDAEFIASLKVAVMFALIATPVAALAGTIELTVGGVVSGELLLPLSQPATNPTINIAINHVSGLVKFSKFFIFVSFIINFIKQHSGHLAATSLIYHPTSHC
jgi:hypothetical protein